jgi:hypothetical protein
MVHNLLSIRHFTADNSCSVEFDSSGLTVKDLASRRSLLRCDNTGPLYTLCFPAATLSSSPSVLSAAFTATTSSTTWHRRLSHPGRDALLQLSRSSNIPCTQTHDEHLCHACQLYVMFVFLFIVPLHMRLTCLILYIVTYGHLLSSVFLDISTILWWSMIFLTIHGLFPCV